MAFHDLVSDWGRSLGMPDLRPNAHGVISLRIESMGDLYLEGAGDDALVYLIRQIPFPNASVYRHALQICHPAERFPFPANAGLRQEDRLAFFIRLSSHDLTLPRLEAAVEQLQRMHERIGQISA